MPKLIAAVVQMNSQASVEDNLAQAAHWLQQASAAGAHLVVLPEYFYRMARSDSDRLPLAEAFGTGPLQHACAALARKHGFWLIAGTLPLQSAAPDRFYNSSLIFDPQGNCVGRYDKIHLFGYDNGRESYQEADTQLAGHEIITTDLPWGKLRPSVCYDLRFPELYRLAAPADFISVPAAFTRTTGQAHWMPLLQARAIENQAFVLAAGQTGEHPNGKHTHGHSMIIDPWGQVLACRSDNEAGLALAELDLDEMRRIRQQLPALDHRIFNQTV